MIEPDQAASIAADRLVEWVLAAPDAQTREARYHRIYTDGVERAGFVELMTEVWLTAPEEGRAPLGLAELWDQVAELLDVIAHPEEDPPIGFWRRGGTAGLVIERLSAAAQQGKQA